MGFRIVGPQILAAGCIALSCLACQRSHEPALSETIQTGSGPAAITSPAGSGTADDALHPLSSNDATFIRHALEVGMGEVELATAVRTHSRNPEVRQLAKDIIDDFNRIDAELTRLAYAQSLSLPSNVASRFEQAKASLASDPIDLDSRYLEMIANDYPDLIRRFQTVTDSAADADLRAVAAPAGQTLQGHLRRAQTIARMLHMPLPAGARQ